MKYWKISENIFFIFKEKSIWATELNQNENIDELIANKELKNTKSYRYTDFSEIIFVDNDCKMILKFTDRQIEEKAISLNDITYYDIKGFLTENLKGVEMKEYSRIKQISPFIFPLVLVIGLTYSIYSVAVDLKNGANVSTSGRRAIFKEIIVGIAEILGPIGCLIIGGLICIFFFALIIKVIKKPKQGKILKIKKFVELKL